MKVWALVVLALCVTVVAADASLLNQSKKEAATATTTAAKTTSTAAAATTKTAATTGAKKTSAKVSTKAKVKKASAKVKKASAKVKKAAIKVKAAAKAGPAAPPAAGAPAAAAPAFDPNAKKTPGKVCADFSTNCAACTAIHMCAWTKGRKCIDASSPEYASAKNKGTVLDACPKVLVIEGKKYRIPQPKRVADIVEVQIGGAADPEPVIATADVVAKLPVGVAIVRPGNWSLIQEQQQQKKEVKPQGYLAPEFIN